MPLSNNVGLSRKASKDSQSTGVSINVTAELDQSLLARPQELEHQIAGLYAQAEQALNRQAEGDPPMRGVSPRPLTTTVRPSRSSRNGNGSNARSNNGA